MKNPGHFWVGINRGALDDAGLELAFSSDPRVRSAAL